MLSNAPRESAQEVAQLFAQAVACHNAGAHARTQGLCVQLLRRQPNHFDALHLLGVSKFTTQDFITAEKLLKHAVALQPRAAAAHYHLGLVQFALKQFNAACASYEMALAVQPNFAVALNNLGNARDALGEHARALESYNQAIALDDGYAEAFYNRAAVLARLERYGEALASFDQALALQPGHALALDGRGAVLIELRRHDEAIASCERALAIRGDLGSAYAHRGSARAHLGQFDQALADYDRGLALSPAFEGALLVGRAEVLLLTQRLAEASASADRALAIAPQSPHALAIAGQCRAVRGEIDAAIGYFDRALAIKPDLAHVITQKIFALEAAPWAGFAELQAARRDWWTHVGSKFAPRDPARHGNDPDPARRIVLGYVSSDFRHHSAAYVFGAVLRHHDHAAFEVVCYSCSPQRDSMTEEFERIADRWVDASRLNDEELANRIRADGIDILIDLSGQTAGHRLAVFARKPAPIAVSAWGSGSGTGLPTIDYLFADPVSTPAEVRHHYAERIHDLPCLITLEAPPAEPRRAEPPCLANGYVTFGIFNRVEKISDNTTRVWSHILSAAPEARLMIKHFALDQPAVARDVIGRFAAHGIAPERITCLGRTTRDEHLAAYGMVDICLDPFPHNGGVSTWEPLHMGVPVVSKLGNSSVGRAGAAILSSIGLADWIAEDEATYVALALKHAATPEYLRQLRRELPERIANSASGNTERYTRAVEDAYRDFWREYCARRAAS